MVLTTFLCIFLAEMADKTQLMMISLASRYQLRQVILGMTLGIICISGFSIGIGSLITAFIPPVVITWITAALFLFFAVSALRTKKEAVAHHETAAPVLSIALAFFSTEMGDKTQLSTIALAAASTAKLEVMLGSALGLLAANLIGLAVGKLLQRFLSDDVMALFSAGVFLTFALMQIRTLYPFPLEWLLVPLGLLVIYGAHRLT